MRAHRLGRLTSLTQGAALVGLGLVQAACGKDAAPPAEPIHINSPPQPAPDAAAPVAVVEPAPSASASSASSASSAGHGLTRPMLNAPPKKLPPAPADAKP
ncbi:MAG TPA: hypothetical protein VLT33_46555 [Labilithrix sp.]|nr:hypothetical protein [Labilithrix sp.]